MLYIKTDTIEKLSNNLYLFRGAVNNGILVSGNKALLIDCCDTLSAAKLAEIGITRVETILCTQHRRPNVSGIFHFSNAVVIVPSKERHLFDDVESYWNDPKNRWHIYHHQPSSQVIPCSFQVAHTVREGNIISWEGFDIHVFDTPGATDGSVSYMLNIEGTAYCFTGDIIYGAGRIWDLYSLQKVRKGEDEVPDFVNDYHGFMGNRNKLISSLNKIICNRADVLIPSHGDIIEDPEKAATLLIKRIDAIFRNYSAISSINFYFPNMLKETKDDEKRMKPVRKLAFPDFVRSVAGFPSMALISGTGAALLIDCGYRQVIDELQQWLEQGMIKSVDACWVTHYHDDHADFLGELSQTFNCPIITTPVMADIIRRPLGYFLPCISPNSAPVSTVEDGHRWRWHEFELTAFHFPGQTLYHSGLLVEGYGRKLFFGGDSFSPTGIDDYCCGNRNFLGKGRGFRRCIDILRRYKPEYIINQHQQEAFSFSDEELDYLDAMLAEREQIFSEALPWTHPDFGTDEWWVCAYPYEQVAYPGSTVSVDVRFTNHGNCPVEASVEPVLPEGWTWNKGMSESKIVVPGKTSGITDNCLSNPDKCARVWISIPENAAKKLYVIPFRITWDNSYLGQFRHALVSLG